MWAYALVVVLSTGIEAPHVYYKHLDQCISNCPKGAEPLVIIKADRRAPVAIVDAEHFFELTKRTAK